MARIQRIRDPIHNLIQFDTSNHNKLEKTLWNIIQTPTFQRLRRIRQLGFSEFVYPGATQTRFAHSIGVFHIARHLITIIENNIRREHGESKLNTDYKEEALAAALVHDVGHGMFSHAFEEVGNLLNINMAKHEKVTELLIMEGDIKKCFDNSMGSDFAEKVANAINKKNLNLYSAAVSSQFDADRLDYMQRDRMMTGVQNSGIDFVWLMNNLEVAEILPPSNVDDVEIKDASHPFYTFALNSKAIHAAESYILSLFHLYPTIYFHKATRGAEKLFTKLMLRLITLIQDKSTHLTGLPEIHPVVMFAKNPSSSEYLLSLDDSVFWGMLPLLNNAKDPCINYMSNSLWNRTLLKCIDIRDKVTSSLKKMKEIQANQADFMELVDRICVKINDDLELRLDSKTDFLPNDLIIMDQGERNPYKVNKNPATDTLNQIYIKNKEDGKPIDIKDISSTIAELKPFKFFRLYHSRENIKMDGQINELIQEHIKAEITV